MSHPPRIMCEPAFSWGKAGVKFFELLLADACSSEEISETCFYETLFDMFLSYCKGRSCSPTIFFFFLGFVSYWTCPPDEEGAVYLTSYDG